ncbi:zinc-binding dehydrogenase [uncultured Cohaesibacter sp.]|uniref:zinc-binding dehydrogenase n=1 Tax=uncultured Cohaesibacter sp. TaxID=1002546 RepID=UPI00292FF13C|nr:zinc-binding dehydrogenase [uncultured Cohaesibacter sp.]
MTNENWTWNMYGAGLENIGKDAHPESIDIPKPNSEQLLVRIDAVSLCFSDVKLINQGGKHPKLYNRDLSKEPGRLGHEVALTVLEVGDALKDQFKVGERYAVQPDIYQNGMSTAYGYTIPGGLIQYHLIGKEMMETDHGICLLKLPETMGTVESALLEPWGCVWASYTQRRRLDPKEGGILWILGQADHERTYDFSKGLDAAGTIILSDAPAEIKALAEKTGKTVIERNGLAVADYDALSTEFTDGKGFDDIVLIEPKSAEQVTEVARLIARRGTLNMVGTRKLDGLVDADVGRLHYDYIAFIGTSGTDIAASYGEERNRCELRKGGTAVFIGAGGPMGQMHVQRAIEMADGPARVIVTDINDERLEEITSRLKALTEANGRELIALNPANSELSLEDCVKQNTNNAGADDVVVCVPSAKLMEEAATLMAPDGMLVLFAGVPNGTLAKVDLSPVYLNNMQYTGTSGLTIHDQTMVMENTVAGNLAPAVCVAAIGGMNVARDGIKAMMDSKYPGKIVIFPQFVDLPLMGLDELKEKLPDVAEHLGAGNVWTREAEKALLAHFGADQ